MEIRIRETGQVVTEREFRNMHSRINIPRPITIAALDSFGADPVLEGAQATELEWWQRSQRDGVEQINGKWFTKYIAGPVFQNEADKEAYIAELTQQRAESIYTEIQLAVHKRLDDFAKTREYDHILSLCTYATDPIPKFATEGQYGVAIRGATWAACYQIMADVQEGNRPMPSGYAEIESELPVLEWPED